MAFHTDHRDHDLGATDSQEKDTQISGFEHPLEHERQMTWTFGRVVAIAALCIVIFFREWVSRRSQIILYFAGGALAFISADLNTTIGNWLLTANTLAVAATCPFVGYMTDLLGRRWITLVGSVFLMISCIVVGTATSLASGIVGMTIGGVGAGICELTAIAGVAEITPVRWRGVTLSLVTFSILPFIPYLIYIEELQMHATWRWAMCIVGVWNFFGFVGLLFFYRPPPRHNVDGLSRMEILGRIDYVGAFLSIGGVTLLLVGLQAGGYPYAWTDARVLGPLISGIVLISLFPLWELYGTKFPMVPSDIFVGQRVVAIALVIVFVAGMNFYSILGFFPVILEDFYETDAITIGVRALGYPLAILGGACIMNALISYTKGHVRMMFLVNSIIMTAFGGALAAATPFNPGFAVTMATIASFGLGAVLVPALTLALYACPDRYIGTTTALSLSVRFLGGSVGTTIYFNVFLTKLTDKLPTYVATAAVGAGLPASSAMDFVVALLGPEGATAAQKVNGVTVPILQAAGLAVRWAYADSLAYVWYTSIAFGAMSCIACLFLPNIRKFMTNRIAVDIH